MDSKKFEINKLPDNFVEHLHTEKLRLSQKIVDLLSEYDDPSIAFYAFRAAYCYLFSIFVVENEYSEQFTNDLLEESVSSILETIKDAKQIKNSDAG